MSIWRRIDMNFQTGKTELFQPVSPLVIHLRCLCRWVNAWAPKEAPGDCLSTKCWPTSQISTQTHPFCGHSLGRAEISSHLPDCSVRLDHGEAIRNQLEIPGSWPGRCHFTVTVSRAQEMWGHLWVSLISPDIDKTQPWAGPGWIAAVAQKVM